DRLGEAQAAKIDVLEPHRVIGVPEEQRLLPETRAIQRVTQGARRGSRMPLLREDDQVLLGGGGGASKPFQKRGGKRGGEVIQLLLLAVIDAARVILAYPLAPAMID